MKRVAVSVVIPAYNEADSLEVLLGEITAVMAKLGKTYEVIFVNDGSTDNTQTTIERLSQHDKHVKGIQFTVNYGKAAGLHAGFQIAQGDYIVTMDADLQDDPAELPKMFAKLDEGYDVISGWKQHRQDSFVKNHTSKLYNAATNAISGTSLHDHNCGYKLYRAETIKDLSLYGQLHRYIPVLVSAQGYKVGEVGVAHRRRTYGKTKYGPARFVNGALDLLTVLFITRFRHRPLHFFGHIGLGSFALGVGIAGYLTAYKLFTHHSIGERPLLLLAVLLIVVGIQIAMTGVVGELMAAIGHERKPSYKIRKVIGGPTHEEV